MLKRVATTMGFAAFAVLAGCASNEPANPSPYAQAQGTYQGTLPCADCSGIKTRLNIRNQDNTGASFTLKSTRIGQSQEPMKTKGQVLVLHDVGPNEYPLVYQLKGTNGNTIYNLLPLNSGDLKLLGKDYKQVQSNNDLTLRKVN
ncbi:NlpE-like protein [Kushneria sinocarnis]|uniref:NlpE-like protein n=1 Tax=Kushneria sinocarnis TaxID=595502 RepID=A0A420WU93_9GAMM|nr:copper resistance protein NlpE N-terminal domain-containing protein [Kushneria sinocarnis]RKQ97016.1 NlpE-like protein [Kushneria sinocarnis]